MALKEGAPPYPLLRFLDFQNQLLQAWIFAILVSFLLDVPVGLLRVGDSVEFVGKIGGSVLEAYRDSIGGDIYFEGCCWLDVRRQWRQLYEAKDSIQRLVPLVNYSALVFVRFSLLFHLILLSPNTI